MLDSASWQPTTFLRFEEALDTSMGTARIVTDVGPAYIKPLGSRQGPHPLACEWVATHLARWFELPTFDICLMAVDASVDEIPFFRGGAAQSGTAFVTRATAGHTWGGTTEELDSLTNSTAIARLVVFDTWTRNCDRYPPDLTARKPNYDNVFLADGSGDEKGKSLLIAMDHTHCFTCGRDLDQKVARIGWVKDDRLYGLFPGFVPKVRQEDVDASIDRLSKLNESFVAEIVSSIPADWQVAEPARIALIELICRRASFVVDNVPAAIARVCWPGQLFDKRSLNGE
jgi:hypothetical protein